MSNPPPKILIVDDSDTVRIQLKGVLQKAGYTVIEANDGEEGVELASSTPDLALILADVNMPKMDGITMCSRIRLKPNLKEIPIVMLTTETSAVLKEQGKAVGVVAWIVKPLNAEKTVAGISKLLAKQTKSG